jgi:outer membrane protein assembly factor BamB
VGLSAVPLTWSDTANLKWKMPLPGPGSSSPIVQGDRVFVTCYSGGGAGAATLTRHLVCVRKADGRLEWQREIAAELPEDPYEGFLTEHGYASSTPVTDARGDVFGFLGKSGVVAFDSEGKKLWQTAVGKESSNRRWGSAASLVLHGDNVIVNAAEESQSIRALDRKTGRQVWKAEGAALELAYGTPGLVTLDDRTQELVIAVPGEVWGMDPATGKMLWHADMGLTGNVSPSVVIDGTTVYVFGGFRSSGSLAVRAGGRGDVTKSHVLWTSRNSSYVATPLLYDGHLYWIDDRGQAFCIAAKTGDLVYRERVEGMSQGGRPVYASPVLSGGRIYVVSRWSGTFVLPAAPRYEILAQNRFESDDSDFSGTPAISDGDLFVRSGRFLYCVGQPR